MVNILMTDVPINRLMVFVAGESHPWNVFRI